MEGKKISFGFLKTKKQDKPALSETKEYIDCLEEKSIKVVGGEVVEEIKPLVIPMKANTLITAERLKAIAEKVENFEEPVIVKQEKEEDPPINESLDQMAVRELMEGAKKIKVEEKEDLVVPVNVKPVLEGQAEATLDDYESVPIQDFGLAMLRGMGWTESKEQSKYKQPQLRPKGLGLGADKVVKDNQKNKLGKDEEELSIVKNSFVKITSGKYSGYYGKVLSLDEDNGRVMVDIIMKKETVSLSEFMMQPVTKSEFDKQSKVINSESYEKYKKNEKLEYVQHNSKTERRETNEVSSSKRANDNRDKERSHDYRTEEREEQNRRYDKYSNGRNRRSRSRETVDKSKDRYRRESSTSEEDRSRHRKKNKKKYSSNESLSSDSDKRKESISRRRRNSSDSSEENYRKKDKSKNKVKKDIDKKRKGKKKKRDRDRSPNYKKHRK